MASTDVLENEEQEEKKSGGMFSKVLIGLLILLPIIIFIIVYSISPGVKTATNNVLSKLPGSLGERFQSVPTQSERMFRVEYLAEHFLEIDKDQATDKLYIIKKDDEKLYSEIVRGMNKISPEEAEEIVINIRNIEMQKDLLGSIYNEALEDEKSRFMSEVSRIESQDNLTNKMEFERRFSNKDFQETIAKLDETRLGEILYYIDSDIRSYLLGTLSNKKRLDVEFEIAKITNERDILVDIAKFYETKNELDALETLGNTETYNIDELATIYSNMSVYKSSKLISKIEDKEFIDELFNAIKSKEELINGYYNISKEISSSIEFLEEYSNKRDHLVKTYGKMSSRKVAEVIESMIDNTETFTMFDISENETFKLSDQIVMIDILSGLKDERLAEILDVLEEIDAREGQNKRLASKVTRLLAKPDDKYYKGGEIDEDRDDEDDPESTNEAEQAPSN